jgi:hypothetical protein
MYGPPPNITPFKRTATLLGGHSTPSKPFVVTEYSPFFIVSPNAERPKQEQGDFRSRFGRIIPSPET